MYLEQIKSIFSCWYFASWNVRTFLDVEGPIETAKQSAESATADYGKTDQVIDDLKMYLIYLAGLQETKWFVAEMYKVGDSIVLSSGRAVPTSRA